MFQSVISNAVRTFGRDDDASSSPPPSKYSNISLSNLSAALSNSPVVESLRRGGAQLYGLLQSKAAIDMSGQNPGQHASPFGYLFPPEGFSEPPEVPHSSEPLLNLQENGFLSQFFQHQQAQQHSPTTAFSAMGQIVGDDRNGSSNYNWLINEPPPTVQHVNSVPPTPGSQHHSHGISPHIGLGELPMNMDESIIGAAALLSQPMQNQPHSPMQSMHTHHTMSPSFHVERSRNQPVQSQHIFSSPAVQQALTSAAMEPVHTHEALIGISSSTVMEPLHATQQSTLMAALLPSIDTSPTTLSAVSMSSAPHTAPAGNRFDQLPNPRLYHFGSDNHFDANGFRPSSDFERHEYREELLSSELRRLKPINRTPDITRAPSPESQRKRPISDVVGTDVDPNQFSHKRKRSDHTEESSTETPEASSKSDRPTERSNSKRQRRSSAPGASRPKRENLSDQQKRQNHIASEQKRRAQIKQGFDELNRIVPELRDSGLSKSGMLMEACNFLELLKSYNEKLCQRLGYSSLA